MVGMLVADIIECLRQRDLSAAVGFKLVLRDLRIDRASHRVISMPGIY